MKAWVIREAGGPEQFQLEDVETPKPRNGWALIRIKAFGLNRETISNRVLAAKHFRFSHTASGISAVFWTSLFRPGCQSSNLLRNSSFKVLTRT